METIILCSIIRKTEERVGGHKDFKKGEGKLGQGEAGTPLRTMEQYKGIPHTNPLSSSNIETTAV